MFPSTPIPSSRQLSSPLSRSQTRMVPSLSSELMKQRSSGWIAMPYMLPPPPYRGPLPTDPIIRRKRTSQTSTVQRRLTTRSLPEPLNTTASTALWGLRELSLSASSSHCRLRSFFLLRENMPLKSAAPVSRGNTRIPVPAPPVLHQEPLPIGGPCGGILTYGLLGGCGCGLMRSRAAFEVFKLMVAPQLVRLYRADIDPGWPHTRVHA